MSRFINRKAGDEEKTGLEDVGMSLLQTAPRAYKETFFGDTIEGQDVLATEVVSEYSKFIKEATGEDIFKFRTDKDHVVNSMRGMGSFDTVQGIKRFEQELKALHEKDPTKFKLKSLDELKQEYITKKDRVFKGEQTENRSIMGSLLGSLGAYMSSPVNAIVGGLSTAVTGGFNWASLAVGGLVSGLGELFIQSEIDSSVGQKAAAVAGATVAPGIFRGIGRGLKVITKKLAGISKKSGTLNRNLVKEVKKTTEKLKDPILKSKIDNDADLLNQFKGSKKEAINSLGIAKKAFDDYKPIGNVTKRNKFIKQPEGSKHQFKVQETSKARFVKKDGKMIPATDAALEKRIESGRVSADPLDNTNIIRDRPIAEIHTTTGKYSTVFDTKSGKALVYKSSTDAERGLKKLSNKGIDTQEMQIGTTPKGEFAIIKSSDVSIIPKVKDFATAKEAEAFIPTLAKKVGLDPEDLKAIKMEIAGKPIYKLATHASKRDVLSAEKGILNKFDEGGAKLETGISEGVEGVPLGYKRAVSIEKGVPLENSIYEKQLDLIMKDDTIKYKLPEYGDKKNLEKALQSGKKAIKAFKDCIG